jgi:hypothetical protein
MPTKKKPSVATMALRALREGVAEAIAQHRRYGLPLRVEQDGKLVALDPRTMKVIRAK